MAEKDPNKKPYKFYKAGNQIDVCFTQEQFDFITQQSAQTGISKSEFIRRIIQSAITKKEQSQ